MPDAFRYFVSNETGPHRAMRPVLRLQTYWLLALVFAVTAGAQPVVVPPAAIPSPSRYAEVVSEARALAWRHYLEQGWPGLSIAVSVDGQTVWAEGFGYADLEQRVPVWPTTKFRVGSISKPLTAAAAALLYAEGRLDVDAPVQRYVPAFPEKRWPVTTRQLGGHLAGIRHYRGDEFLLREHFDTVVDGLALFAADTLLFEPGTRYRYSSYGWNLISAVIEGAAGQDFLRVMQERVFDPLGMRNTVADHVDSLITQRVRFYARDEAGRLVNAPFVDNSYKWAGGGFLSTTEDLLRFANAHLGDDFLPPAARTLLFTEQRTSAGEGVGYGFGWALGTDAAGRRVISHSGGSVGGTSILLIQPETRVVVVALVNLSGADLRLGREVFDRFVAAAAAE
ncbi:MAG: serine hydrolase [Rhodothermaceae bacterium]|nr:MAG: serine hydrolase [Rhodothermaceae bacterium]